SKSPNSMVAAEAILKIGRKQGDGLRARDPREEALTFLRRLLDESRQEDKWADLVAGVLREVSDARFLSAYVRAVERGRSENKLTAAMLALERFGPQAAQAVPGLVRLLDHDTIAVRLSAARTLHAIRPGHRLVKSAMRAFLRQRPDCLAQYLGVMRDCPL